MLNLLAVSAATIVLVSSAPVVTATPIDAPSPESSDGADPAAFEPVVVALPAAAPGPAQHHDHGIAETVERPAVSLRPAVDVVGASHEQIVAVDEALDRFRNAGLQLPDVEIVFHDDQAACKGHDGLFQAQHTPWRILVCSDLAFVLTHELAHAWEAATLDDVDRERYVELRRLSTWNSADADWDERGVEDAAFMIQQNLMAERVDVDSERWVVRTAAYEALTGRQSPVLA